MTYPQAIVIAAALLAAAIYFTNGSMTAQAQRTGPWQVVAAPEGKGVVAWRFKPTTGELEWCRAAAGTTPVICKKMPPP